MNGPVMRKFSPGNFSTGRHHTELSPGHAERVLNRTAIERRLHLRKVATARLAHRNPSKGAAIRAPDGATQLATKQGRSFDDHRHYRRVRTGQQKTSWRISTLGYPSQSRAVSSACSVASCRASRGIGDTGGRG